jgi:predicted alpha/beta-hydrolase family hydrolase
VIRNTESPLPDRTWIVGETSAVLERADGEAGALFVAAHGAGSHRDHRSMLELSRTMRAHGFDVVRFNFVYREKGRRVPDPMPKLQACFAAVVDRARNELGKKKLVIGGRSMGGRVASMLAAEGFACDGLLLLAYPLHPAGKLERMRAEHLPRIKVPVLCVNGTRDALCTRELMDAAIANLGWDMRWLDGKDHSFAITDEVGALAKAWLARL